MSRLKPEEVAKNYMRDLANCAAAYLHIRHCPGGRPIVDGYICPHCDRDTSYGTCGGVVGKDTLPISIPDYYQSG